MLSAVVVAVTSLAITVFFVHTQTCSPTNTSATIFSVFAFMFVCKLLQLHLECTIAVAISLILTQTCSPMNVNMNTETCNPAFSSIVTLCTFYVVCSNPKHACYNSQSELLW
jgi:hypothetical protein